jgi:hypothetical protein
MTVYDEQNFISRHFVTAVLPDTGTVTLSSYSITTAAAPVGVNFATGVTVSIAGSSLTISGKYRNVFNDESWVIRGQERNTSLSTYTSVDDIPDRYYAVVEYQPDLRAEIAVNISIVTDKGSTSLTQLVNNDWSLKRNRFIDVIYAADVDRNTFNRNVLLAGPADIDSDEINTTYIFTTSISVNTTNYNLYNDALLAGWSGINPILATVTVDAGVYVYSTNTGTAGFDAGNEFPAGSSMNLINNGFIIGMGGNGVMLGDGLPGGPAMNINLAVSITNNSYIAGGGGGGAGGWETPLFGETGAMLNGVSGGGGAGGGSCVVPNGTDPAGGAGFAFGGVGGGPGQSGTNGTFNNSEQNVTGVRCGGGGGGRILPGVGGVSIIGNQGTSVQTAVGGRGGGAGGGGGAKSGSAVGLTTSGAGGSANAVGGNSQCGGPSGVPGGGGGGWGASGGSVSQNPSNPNTRLRLQSPGAGGKAINLNGNSVTFAVTGSVYGAVS